MNIALNLYRNFKIDFFFIIKLLFYSFPIILIFPSGYITAHVSLLTIASLIAIYKNNLKIEFLLIDYLIFLLFFLSIFSTLINISTLGNIIFIKSILDIRFAIFFLVVRNLLVNKIVNLKFLSIISIISSILLSFDIFLQHLIGYNIVGIKPFDGRYNSFFEHEAIAGSYIQKFFLLSLLSVFLLKFKKINRIFLITFIINTLGMGVLLSLDRMPFLILIFATFTLLLFLKNFRILILSNIIILTILFLCLLKNYEVVKSRYKQFDRDINFSKILASPIIKNYIKSSNDQNKTSILDQKLFYGDYYKIYNAAYTIFTKKYLIGSGVKSFGHECNKLPSTLENISCNNHPHNIYLEILVNLGVIGICIFVIFLLFLVNKIIKYLFNDRINNHQKITLILFITIFITELIPFRSYGSIFQTNNGSIFWFFLGLIGYINTTKLHKRKNTS
jgi:hypothetical protein